MWVETTKTGSVRPGGARERLHRLGGVVVEEGATVDVPVGMPASRGTMGHAPGHSVVLPMCAPLVGGTTKEWRVPKRQRRGQQLPPIPS